MQEGMDFHLYQLYLLKKGMKQNTKLRICSWGDQYFLLVVYDIIGCLLCMDSIEHVLNET